MKTLRYVLLVLLVVLAAPCIASAQGWHIETVDSTGDVGWHTSLALNSKDNPHISYWDGTNSDLKYAYMESPSPGAGDGDGGGCFISSF